MIDLDSSEWADALRNGLGAQVLRLPGSGGLLTCFRAGPFKVAYPDFLIGSELVDDLAIEGKLDGARHLRADVVRVQGDQALRHPRVYARHALGSIAIPSLDGWIERGWEKARRAANRQARSALVIRVGKKGDGVHLHALYLSTMSRHGGAIRYTAAYFEAIAPHAALVATLDGEICGFVCIGHSGARGCYMHGAHAHEARMHYSSDQLLLIALRSARCAGLSSFDFLPSPIAQESLAAYKRAWGGVDIPMVVSDLALHRVRAHAFSMALGLSRRVASIRKR